MTGAVPYLTMGLARHGNPATRPVAGTRVVLALDRGGRDAAATNGTGIMGGLGQERVLHGCIGSKTFGFECLCGCQGAWRRPGTMMPCS